ncbi:MAG: NAD-dependent deacetylase [Rhodothermales bacterium]
MSHAPFSQELVNRLAHAQRVAVLTGAGISAESGIPTFRDPGGLWKQFKPEELANVRAFLNNPELVQGWYMHRRSIAREKAPNPGHRALVDLEDIAPDFTLITQNVDNLHQRAGSKNVEELHGNITRSYCIDCGTPATEEDLSPLASGSAARCSACDGYTRPDVVWFGEMLPEGVMERAGEAAQQAEVFLSIGTSAVVYPAAGLPLLAKDSGAYVAEVNIQASAIADYLDEVVLGKAGTVLPMLVDAVKKGIRHR